MAVKCSDRFAGLVLVAPLGIKVGDRETRDIPDIFALPPDEVTRLQYRDPAARRRRSRHALRRPAHRDRAQPRGDRALRLGAVLPQPQAPSMAAPDHAADPAPVGRRRSVRHRRPTTAPPTGPPSRAPGSRRSIGAGHFPHLEEPGALAERIRGSSPSERRRSAVGMRAWFFSENAYHLLPDPKEYDSIRVKLPNRYYDPKIGADLYHRFIDEWHDRRGPGPRDHGERAPPDGDQPEPVGGRRDGRARARHAQGSPADPRQPDREPARAGAGGRGDGDGRRLLARPARVRVRARRAVRDVGGQSSADPDDGALLGGPRPDRQGVDQPRRARSTGRASTSITAR